jgi:hypothetical protein
LKLVIGVEISRREVKRSGREVCVKSSRRRRKAATRTRGRRFERGGEAGSAIEGAGAGNPPVVDVNVEGSWIGRDVVRGKKC